MTLSTENIDRISFQLGMINCFVEMVACGVKNLALSPPMTPEDYEIVKPLSDRIVEAFGMKSWLEKDLIATDLQSDDFVAGKWVMLYYASDEILDAYLELKKQRAAMDDNALDPDALKELSRAFMRLLSYTDEVIDAKLSGRHQDPFLLID
ncbi:MAG: hypothetical protein D3926_16155 [Desulfobacteraceae bacterium]|nr:MAG: hypothetical protein D3926_16155 [Desulfobacteraceae bacterium]